MNFAEEVEVVKAMRSCNKERDFKGTEDDDFEDIENLGELYCVEDHEELFL
jgi:hypothetical protein